MSKFKPGDKCLICPSLDIEHQFRHWIGQTVTLANYLGNPWGNKKHSDFWTFEEGGDSHWVSEDILQKIPPIREDLELVKWDDCPWQPELEVIPK